MVKEVEIDVQVPQCNIQAYYDAIYNDPDVFRLFHKDINKCETATVTPWEDGKRTVTFGLALTIPAVVKKVVGVDQFSVQEQQTLKWQDEKTFTVASLPLLDFPGSSKFVTPANFKIEQTDNGDVKVTATISCTASVPWPMQSTVEAIMADQAKVTVGQFLDYCKQYMSDLQARQQLGKVAVPLAEIAAGVLVHADEEEEYYDAARAQSPLSMYSAGSEFSMFSSSSGQAEVVSVSVSQRMALAPPPPENFEVAVLQYLSQLSQQQACNIKSLQALQEELQAVGEQLRRLQQASRRDSYWWYGTLLLATSASAVAYLYWRRAHRS